MTLTRIRSLLSILVLSLAIGVAPVAAEDEPSHLVVSGTILLPEGAILPADTTVRVGIEDVLVADASAVTISSLVMAAAGADSPIPFALSYLPVAYDPVGIYTLAVSVESADGTLLYANDFALSPIDDSGPVTGMEVELVAAT